MNKRFIPVVLVLLALAAFFLKPHVIGMRAEEPRRALVAFEAWQSGDYLVPHVLGTPYYNKPPVFNCILAGFYWVCGSHQPRVARLPGLLSLLATGWLMYLFGRKYLGRQTAFLAGLSYITASDILFYASVNAGEIDLFFALLTFLQAMVIFSFYEKKQWYLLFVLSYLLAAISVLTKGLPGMAFQALTLLGIFLAGRRGRKLFHPAHFLGIALFFMLVGGYFYLYFRKGGNAEGFLVNLFKESSQRSVNEYGIREIIPQLVRFPLQFLGILFPWSLLLWFCVRRGFGREVKVNPLLWFSLLFVLVNILIYWLSPHVKNRYLYMFFPFILYVFWYFYAVGGSAREKHWMQYLFGGMLLLIIPLMLGFPLVPRFREETGISFWPGLLFSLPAAGIFLLFLKRPAWRMQLFIAGLLLMRIWFNFTFIPYFHAISPTSDYQQAVLDMVGITGDKPVYYYDEPTYNQPDVSLFGKTLLQTEILQLPEIPYALPYYYSLANGRVMQYLPQMERGNFYLTHQENVPEEGSILYTFWDDFNKTEMVLLRFGVQGKEKAP